MRKLSEMLEYNGACLVYADIYNIDVGDSTCIDGIQYDVIKVESVENIEDASLISEASFMNANGVVYLQKSAVENFDDDTDSNNPNEYERLFLTEADPTVPEGEETGTGDDQMKPSPVDVPDDTVNPGGDSASDDDDAATDDASDDTGEDDDASDDTGEDDDASDDFSDDSDDSESDDADESSSSGNSGSTEVDDYGKFDAPIVKVSDEARDHQMYITIKNRYESLLNIKQNLQDLKNKTFDPKTLSNLESLISIIDTVSKKTKRIISGKNDMKYINLRLYNRGLEIMFHQMSVILNKMVIRSEKEQNENNRFENTDFEFIIRCLTNDLKNNG